MLKFLGIISTNLMFSPPEDWTLLQPDHAVKNSNSHEEGELIQIKIAEKNLDQLGFALMDRGFNLESIALNPYGHADISLSDRVGHARWSSKHQAWSVLLSSETHFKSFDLNLFFQAVQLNHQTVKSGNSNKSKNWVPISSDGKWGRAKSLQGKWGGSSQIKGLATRITLLFESDGTLRIERALEGKSTTVVGKWMTHKDNLRLIYSNQSKVKPYRQLGSTLQFEFEQANITFYRK